MKEEGEKKTQHVCGAINGVMGKGAFTKEDDKFRCVECGKCMTSFLRDT